MSLLARAAATTATAARRLPRRAPAARAPTPTRSAALRATPHAAFSASAAAPTTPTPASGGRAVADTDADAGDGDGDGAVLSILGTRLTPADATPAVLAALDVRNATRAEQRKARRRGIVERFRRSPSDTGSPEVQVAILTDRIKDLTTHMLENKKDTARKRTMSILVNQRRALMSYLLRKSPQRYMTLVSELGLRPSSVFSKDVPLGAKKAPAPMLR